jgi:hypothetical protein
MLAKNANEIKRTYFVTNPKNGMKFFKLYTPSEAQKAFKKNGWKGKIVGKLDLLEDRKKVPYDPNWKKKQDDEQRKYISSDSHKWVKKYDNHKVDSIRMSDFARV